MPDIFRFVSEVHRVLDRDGRFVFTAPNLAFMGYRFMNLLGWTSGDLMPPTHTRCWGPHSINYFFDNRYFSLDFLRGG